MTRRNVVLVGESGVDAYVSVSAPDGSPVHIQFLGAKYRWTREKTAGGWRVYRRVA